MRKRRGKERISEEKRIEREGEMIEEKQNRKKERREKKRAGGRGEGEIKERRKEDRS